VRPAVVVSSPHSSQDILITPLTSKTGSLFEGEFVLAKWSESGLNVVTAVKRGVYTVNQSLVLKGIGRLADVDIERLCQSLLGWLGL
jgi:mRNA interferase MazF